MAAIAKGGLVYASDGALLGTVSDLREGHFKLDSPMALDFWLPMDCLQSRSDDVLMTRFPEAELDVHRVEPGSL
jgi:hypothetical protein